MVGGVQTRGKSATPAPAKGGKGRGTKRAATEAELDAALGKDTTEAGGSSESEASDTEEQDDDEQQQADPKTPSARKKVKKAAPAHSSSKTPTHSRGGEEQLLQHVQLDEEGHTEAEETVLQLFNALPRRSQQVVACDIWHTSGIEVGDCNTNCHCINLL